MSPAELIRGAGVGGVHLSVSEDGELDAAGTQAALDHWLPLIRPHKDAVLLELKVVAMAPVGAYPDMGGTAEEEPWCGPAPVTHVDCKGPVAGWSAQDSVDAEAEQRARDEILRSCAHCRLRRRPGHAFGYCGGERPDLPLAYGEGHPLRLLPSDGGWNCDLWQAR